MKAKRKILIVLSIVVLCGVMYGVYVWNKPMRDVADETGIPVTASVLYNDYIADETASNTKYLNRALEVTGVVADVKKNDAGATYVILQTEDPMFGINCTFKEEPPGIAKGQTITLKGICTAYLDDVIVNQAIQVKK